MNPINWMPPELANALALTFLHSLWQGLLIILLTSLLLRHHRIRNSEASYIAYLSGLFLLFFCCLFSFLYFYGDPAEWTGPGMWSSHADSEWTILTHDSGKSSFNWPLIVSNTWMAGVLFFLIKSLWSAFQLQSIRTNSREADPEWIAALKKLELASGICKNVRLLSSPKITVPIAMGILRPVIIFPTAFFTHLNPDQVESIILHELGHIRRNDYLFNLFQCLIESLLFFNPASWYLNRQIRKYREFQCDDLVQSQIKDKNSYLEALYKVAYYAVHPPKTAPSLFHNKSILIMRVKRLLNTPSRDFQLKPALGFLIGVLIFIGSYAFTLQTDSHTNQSNLQGEIFTDRAAESSLNMIEVPAIQVLPRLIDNSASSKSSRIVQEIPKIAEELIEIIPRSTMDLSDEKSVGNVDQDTIKENERIRELKKQIEVLSMEIEQMAEAHTSEMELSLEQESKRMEELAEQLEQKMEPLRAELEESQVDPEKIKRLEELGEQLEERMHSHMEGFEDRHHEIADQYEDQMHTLAEQLEDIHDSDDEVDQAEVKRIKEQMSEIRMKMKEAMKGIKIEHEKIRNDPEIQVIREEMNKIQKEIRSEHETLRHNHEMDEETKELHQEMRQIQRSVREKMRSVDRGMRDQLRHKTRELEKLSRELQREVRKLRQEKNENNN